MSEPSFEFSNAVRLTGRQWVLVGLLTLGVVLFLPGVWSRAEKFDPEADYRVPYELSTDYWHYARYAAAEAERADVLALGDSVVWGEYVTRRETLPYHLSRMTRKRCANLGLNGLQPATMVGLLDGYARFAGKKVLLHCNPLWMTSDRRDLSFEPQKGDDDVQINHPALLPQFVPKVPAYRAEVSKRIGYVVQRYLPFNAWTDHLQVAYFDSKSVPAWTMDHPYESPLRRLTFRLPAPSDEPRHPGQKDWKAAGGVRQRMEWVELGKSIQWRSFRSVVGKLRDRGNSVYVLVGPFNEHLLTDASREQYRALKAGIVAWLREQNVPHDAPEPLPSELYPDASHPFAEGYERLAHHLAENPFFR